MYTQNRIAAFLLLFVFMCLQKGYMTDAFFYENLLLVFYSLFLIFQFLFLLCVESISSFVCFIDFFLFNYFVSE